MPDMIPDEMGTQPKGGFGYILQTAFDSAPDQVFTDGQILDTPNEGVTDGSLVSQISGIGGLCSISGGKLKINTGSNVFSASAKILYGEVAIEEGRGYFWTLDSTFSIGMLSGLFSSSAFSPTSYGNGALFTSGTNLYLSGAVGGVVDFGAISFPASFGIVDFGGSEFGVFLLVGSTYNLLVTFTPLNPDSLFFQMANQGSTGYTIVNSITIPDVLYLAQVTAAKGGQTTGFVFEGM